jgi:hypothetical protein
MAIIRMRMDRFYLAKRRKAKEFLTADRADLRR